MKQENQLGWEKVIRESTEDLAGRLIDRVFDGVPLTGKTVLDAGCATGMFTWQFVERGAARVTGFDCNRDSLDQAVARARKYPSDTAKRADFVFGYSEAISFPPASYDIIFANGIICYVDCPDVFVRHLATWQKPGGVLYITFIKKNLFFNLLNPVRRLLYRHGCGLWNRVLVPGLSLLFLPIMRLMGSRESRRELAMRLHPHIVPIRHLHTVAEATALLKKYGYEIERVFPSASLEGWSTEFGLRARRASAP